MVGLSAEEGLDRSAGRRRREDRDAIAGREMEVASRNDEFLVSFDGHENSLVWPRHVGYAPPREVRVGMDLAFHDHARGPEPSDLANIAAERRPIR